MPVFETSTGAVNVKNWGYMLQQSGGLNAADVAKEKHDLIVIDFSKDGTGTNKFSKLEISEIKDGPGGRSVVASYLSIGEASEFRDHWETTWTSNGRSNGADTSSAPDWLGPINPEWPESRKVRYWDKDWQGQIFNDAKTGWLDEIVDQGFDAAYLDIVDAYYYWAVEVPNALRKSGDPAKNDEQDAAKRMIDFIVDMTAHARETNPDFFVILQNGAFIMDALDGDDSIRKAALLDAIGAIAVEDVFYGGDKDENNFLRTDDDAVKILQSDFLENGIPVFSVDYVSYISKVNQFEQIAIKSGFIPYAAPKRDLDVMGDQLGGGRGNAENNLLSGNNQNNKIYGESGSDILQGFDGNDRLAGGKGRDFLYGDEGKDKLIGGRGNDFLTGGAGRDDFVFGKKHGTDRILDFEDGKDKVHLKRFDFNNEAQALRKFFEIGGASNDKVGFNYKGTKIIIKGVDLADLSAADIII